MQNVIQMVSLLKKTQGVSKDKEVEELLGMRPMGLASLKRENRVGSFLKFLVPFVKSKGLSVDTFLIEVDEEEYISNLDTNEKGEEDMWRDKYVSEMELNRKLHLEISDLKSQLLEKQITFSQKKRIG
tara:strand:- start:1371 stop:1754 length:384 start_codon:yes stop_codon:yes gene_type:complete